MFEREMTICAILNLSKDSTILMNWLFSVEKVSTEVKENFFGSMIVAFMLLYSH